MLKELCCVLAILSNVSTPVLSNTPKMSVNCENVSNSCTLQKLVGTNTNVSYIKDVSFIYDFNFTYYYYTDYQNNTFDLTFDPSYLWEHPNTWYNLNLNAWFGGNSQNNGSSGVTALQNIDILVRRNGYSIQFASLCNWNDAYWSYDYTYFLDNTIFMNFGYSQFVDFGSYVSSEIIRNYSYNIGVSSFEDELDYYYERSYNNTIGGVTNYCIYTFKDAFYSDSDSSYENSINGAQCRNLFYIQLVGVRFNWFISELFTSNMLTDSYYSKFGLSDWYIKDGNYSNYYSDGYNTGYANGYSAGYSAGEDVDANPFVALFNSIFNLPLLYIQDLCNFELFGVNINGLVTGLITFMFVLWMLKKIIF